MFVCQGKVLVLVSFFQVESIDLSEHLIESFGKLLELAGHFVFYPVAEIPFADLLCRLKQDFEGPGNAVDQLIKDQDPDPKREQDRQAGAGGQSFQQQREICQGKVDGEDDNFAITDGNSRIELPVIAVPLHRFRDLFAAEQAGYLGVAQVFQGDIIRC